jgi:hypothetical protein
VMPPRLPGVHLSAEVNFALPTSTTSE